MNVDTLAHHREIAQISTKGACWSCGLDTLAHHREIAQISTKGACWSCGLDTAID